MLRILDRWAGIPFLYAASLARKWGHKPKIPDQPERIGIICLGAIGDLLLTAPLAAGLHRRFPGASIEYITSLANADAVPLLSHISSSFSAPVTQISRLIRHIRARRFDVLIDTGQWARISALLSALSGARITLGFDTPGQNRGVAFDLSIVHNGKIHEIDNFLALAQPICGKIPLDIELNLPAWAQQGKYIYCHMFPAPGRGRQLKEWPYTHWAGLINALLARGYNVRLTGGHQDKAACEDFIERFSISRDGVQILAGLMPLKELGLAFCASAAVISVNTGIMHLAAMSGAPTIGLHGATDPLRWGPVGKRCISLSPCKGQHSYLNLGFEYPADATPAMKYITVENVIESLRELKVDI